MKPAPLAAAFIAASFAATLTMTAVAAGMRRSPVRWSSARSRTPGGYSACKRVQ